MTGHAAVSAISGVVNTDQVPPENFKWFYEAPYDEAGSGQGTAVVTSVSRELPNGERITEYFHQGSTWVSRGEDGAAEDQYHLVKMDFPFGFEGTEDDPLKTFADLLQFSTGNSEVDAILNGFLENLMIYPEASYHRDRLGTGGINLQA